MKKNLVSLFLAFCSLALPAQNPLTYGPLPSDFKNDLPKVKSVINMSKIEYYSKGEYAAADDSRLTEKELQKYALDTRAGLQNPTWSPDRMWIAYTCDNNLFTYNIFDRKEIQLTRDGSALIKNGYASWVYYEEILGRPSRYRSFWWSPDSRSIAFFRYDDAGVPVFPIYVSEGQHGHLEQTAYPKAGDPNPRVKIGMIAADGSKPAVWADFDPAEDQYFGRPFWTPDSKKLWLQWMNRDQNVYVLYAVDPKNGSKTPVYSEEQATWIDWIENPSYTKEGLVFSRDFTGWEQLYLCPFKGGKTIALTSGKNWGIQIIKIDEARKTLYYASRCRESTAYDLYRVPLPSCSVAVKSRKEPRPKRLTPGEYNYGNFTVSDDAQCFTATYTNISTPPRLGLFSMKKGLIRDLGDSRGKAFDSQKLPQAELLRLTADGFTFPAVVIWPENMDKNKQYPVMVNIYGGPNAGTVMDSWPLFSAKTLYWARQGVIQVNMDHRGSGHCGKAGLATMYRCLGKWEINDYKLWIDLLRKYPWVNPDKVGITGYSYGGYITALAVCTAGDYFSCGISGGGVYDWTLYDSHYTERFMDLPRDNPQGYEAGSVIRHTANYASFGKPSLLLITHGTSDDNVHFQHSMQLVETLMKTGKPFEFMMYPGARHGYRGKQAVFSTAQDIAFWKRCLLDK